MINPLPKSPYTHVCVICYTSKRRKHCSAKWVNHRGHALCHEHKDHDTHYLITGQHK